MYVYCILLRFNEYDIFQIILFFYGSNIDVLFYVANYFVNCIVILLCKKVGWNIYLLLFINHFHLPNKIYDFNETFTIYQSRKQWL